ncbi:MAG: hypothetical protein LBR77_06460 [Lachnospiraceae bacterium]|jgi:hypothetical protein|nr:hypothetical protein [Lachnospiraceae bacterium]
MGRRIKTIFTIGALTCAFSFSAFLLSAFAGEWLVSDGQARYIGDDGAPVVDAWMEIDGALYRFDAYGAPIKDAWVEIDGARYRFDADGALITDAWAQVDGAWYRFGTDGAMLTGWYGSGPGLYWLGEDGTMATAGHRIIGGTAYDIAENGVCTPDPLYSGWVQDGRGWWYLDRGGSYPAATWFYWQGDWYHFDGDGYMQTGWLQDGAQTYYLSDSGAMVHDATLNIGGANYTFDSSGASASSFKAPVYIPPDDEKSDLHRQLDSIADGIIAQITDDSMTQRQKAAAIYYWIRGSVHYVGTPCTRDWVLEAYNGITRRRGNCFVYFSLSVEMLSRIGIPSIEVIRSTDADHYWNLINLDGAWYHFDTTPRGSGGDFLFWTDAQMLSYSARHYNCFAFDRSLYPPTP